MLVSPAEHSPVIKALGKVSSLPEKYGCDVTFTAKRMMYGIQRKEFKDFLASVVDGRLGMEVSMMAPLEQAIVVIEGKPRWTLDGELVGDGWGIRWDLDKHLGLLFSLNARGVWVMGSDDVAGTARVCRSFEAWVKKDRHSSLDARPGPRGNSWGRKTNRDFQCHVLQGFPGIGPVQANAILDAVGMPLQWVDGVEERLLGIKGVGKKTVEKLMKAL